MENGQFRVRQFGGRVVVTWLLLIINALLWLSMEISGGSTSTDTLRKFGALYTPYVVSGDYWRLFSAMFLHVGMMHFINNAAGMIIFGVWAERLYGHYQFLVIYILSGLFGSLASLWLTDSSMSAGASGAIFGISGALIAHFLRNRAKIEPVYKQVLVALLIMSGINLFIGFALPSIDNWAHMGGLFSGLILGYFLDPTTSGSLKSRFLRKIKIIGILALALTILFMGILLVTENGSDVSRSQNYVDQAGRLLREYKHRESLVLLGKAITLDPANASAYFMRGKVWSSIGDSSQAIDDFRKSVSLGGLNQNDSEEAVRAIVNELSRKGF